MLARCSRNVGLVRTYATSTRQAGAQKGHNAAIIERLQQRNELGQPLRRNSFLHCTDLQEESQRNDRNAYKVRAFASAIKAISRLDRPIRFVSEARAVGSNAISTSFRVAELCTYAAQRCRTWYTQAHRESSRRRRRTCPGSWCIYHRVSDAIHDEQDTPEIEHDIPEAPPDPVQEKLMQDLQLVRGIGCVTDREFVLNLAKYSINGTSQTQDGSTARKRRLHVPRRPPQAQIQRSANPGHAQRPPLHETPQRACHSRASRDHSCSSLFS